MKTKLPLAVLLTGILLSVPRTLFSSDALETSVVIEHLFHGVRIPNIVVAADGSVLAFGKSGNLLRRSTDGGRTWSESQQVGEAAGGSAMVDQNTGDVMVVDPRSSALWRSSDHGRTWEREAIVVKSNPAGHGAPESGVPAQTTCSESGITLQFGKHKGRLLMPARCQPPLGNNDQLWWPYNYNTAIYSDDGGKTWQTSGPVQSGTGEGTLAELSNGDIYYNSRSHMSTDHRRQISYSYDGGAMFTDWRVDEHLREVGQRHYFKFGRKPSYGINAGLVRLPLETTGGKDVLLFSMPDTNGGGRERMTVWASFDRGETWPVKRLVYPGPSAYSSLAAGPDGAVYLLFERGEKKLYEHLSLARFDLGWVRQGEPTGHGKIPD
jgi:sialidase-1